MMITVNIMAYSTTAYNKQSAVKLIFPTLPRNNDYIHLPEYIEIEMVKRALENRQALNNHACWVVGKDIKDKALNFENLDTVREIDWWPSEWNNDTMDCYISLDNILADGNYHSEYNNKLFRNGPFSEEEYLQIRKNTFKIYGIEETCEKTKETHA